MAKYPINKRTVRNYSLELLPKNFRKKNYKIKLGKKLKCFLLKNKNGSLCAKTGSRKNMMEVELKLKLTRPVPKLTLLFLRTTKLWK
jgi:hypothetical protein